MADVAIKVSGVSKSFKLPHEKHNSIKGLFLSLFSGRRKYEKQQVLKDVSFEIKKGEFFGIVGRNGSGKSTLLKLLAGIYTPEKGHIQINGKLTPFIELGVGFNPELTGRENVFLNGALLGFNRKEMEGMYDDIVEFAELEKFMDQKLKNYSSGMQVRLAFSVAIRANTDVLVLDEVLAVGDASFQKKCYDYFSKLKGDKKTVVLVTHDMSAVRSYCDRAILVNDGNIEFRGSAEDTAQAYQKLFTNFKTKRANSQITRWGSGHVKVDSQQVIVQEEQVTIKARLKVNREVPSLIAGFQIFNTKGVNLFESDTDKLKIDFGLVKKGQDIELIWTMANLFATGTYSVNLACCDRAKTEFYDWANEAIGFEIMKEYQTAGIIDPEVQANWRHL